MNKIQKYPLLVTISPLFITSCASPYSNAQRFAKGETNSVVIEKKMQNEKGTESASGLELKAIKYVVNRAFKKLKEDSISSSSQTVIASRKGINSADLHFVYVRGYNKVGNSISNDFYSKSGFIYDIENKFKLGTSALRKQLKTVNYISMAAVFKIEKTSSKPLKIKLLGYSYPILKAASYKGLGKLEQKKQAISITLTPPVNAGDSIAVNFPIEWKKGDAKWHNLKKGTAIVGDHAFMPINTTHTKVTVELIESSDIEKYFEKLQEKIEDRVEE